MGRRRLELARAARVVAARPPGISRQTLNVVVFTAAVALAAAVVFATVVDRTAAPAFGFTGAAAVVAVLFAVTEAWPVHLHYRGEAHSLSLSDAALVLGLFVLTPGTLLGAQLLGGLVAVTLLRRQRPIKVAFNLAQYGLTCAVAVVVFQLVTPHGDAFGLAGWIGAMSAAMCAAVAGVALVSVVINIAGGGGAIVRELPLVLAITVTSSMTCACVALIVVVLVHADPRAIWLVAGPAVACTSSFYVTLRQRRRHEHTEFLYAAMRRIQEAPDLAGALRELLDAGRRMVNAERATIVLLPRRADGVTFVATADGETSEPVPFEPTPAFALALGALEVPGTTIVLPRGRDSHVLDAYLRELGATDGIAACIGANDRVSAILCVGNRGSDVATFTPEDGKILAAFTRHAGVVLEHGRVLDELHEMAFTDMLTQLPNRLHFTVTLADALEAGRAHGTGPTVLFVDLDDFKTVNDSLGHTPGDHLLVEVAARLRTVAPEGFVARFGGDEFALMLDGADDAAATHAARRILRLFQTPFFVGGREVRIHTSVGIATGGRDGTSVEEVLRNADAAMYAAKDAGKRGFAVFEPEMHERAKRRQALAAAFERGLERGEIEVHYQPIIELETGRIHAFEALARWRHPDLGLIPPAAFIPLAEERGVSAHLTRIVLQDACRSLAAWRQAHEGLLMSVNISAPDLLRDTLVGDISGALADAGLASSALLIEITESAALRDPEVTATRLNELRSQGVRVALDDFGTGHSSLAYLRDLPIDCLKIAKEFLDGLHDHPAGDAFIVAIARLAHALEIDVVAEGIESAAAAATARAHCRYGQGFHYGRPMDASAAGAHLHSPPTQVTMLGPRRDSAWLMRDAKPA